MSVLGASLLADALVGAGASGDEAIARVRATSRWHAPHLLPAEVMSTVRGLRRGGHVSAPVAASALDRLRRMRIAWHDFDPYHERVWELADNATVYDAWYVAVAERLGSRVVTRDAKLARIPGIRCEVELVASDLS